jgi:hypothetical protein
MIDLDNAAFRNEILGVKERVEQQASEPLLETIPFKLFRSLIISEMAKSPDVDMKSISISKTDFNQLSEDLDEQVKALFASDAFIKNRHIVVDSQLKITAVNNEEFAQDSSQAIQMYCESSRDGKLIFLLSHDNTLSYFINGNNYGALFATANDLALYKRKKTVDELDQVFEDYRNYHITDSNNYQKFFVSLTELRSLHKDLKSTLSENDFIDANKQLVKNKPESYFRDDLLSYLQGEMRARVSKEFTLNDDDRIDILVQDEAGLGIYFIEVKWVGTSIHHSGKQIGSTFNPVPKVVPEGYQQTIKYIKKLTDLSYKVKLGYLVVFDARKEDVPGDSADGRNSDMLEAAYKDYERQFRKVPDFRVLNKKPR